MKPRYVEDMTCPSCGAKDAVGLVHDDSESSIGWCECGQTWTTDYDTVVKFDTFKTM